MVHSKSRSENRRNSSRRTNTNRTKRASTSPGSRPSGPKGATSNQHRYEHYISLARDAESGGDVIEAENLYQHAEHFLRAMQD